MERKVGIILVNYNGYEDTIECIDSLKNTKYSCYELIVVDNGSTKKPSQYQIDIINENCIFISNDKNLGFSGGNNLGIRRAIKDGCDYVLLLNNDTIVEPDFLNNLVDEAVDHPEAGLVCGKIRYFYDKNRIWYAGGEFDFKRCMASHTLWNKIDTDESLQTREITFATGCLMLIPIDVIKSVGELSEDYFLYVEDTDYCCRVLKAGYTIRYCNGAVIYHKVNASTGTGSLLSQYYTTRNTLMLIKRFSTNKLYGYLYFIYRLTKEIINRKKNVKCCFCGVFDFLREVQGKKNIQE